MSFSCKTSFEQQSCLFHTFSWRTKNVAQKGSCCICWMLNLQLYYTKQVKDEANSYLVYWSTYTAWNISSRSPGFFWAADSVPLLWRSRSEDPGTVVLCWGGWKQESWFSALDTVVPSYRSSCCQWTPTKIQAWEMTFSSKYWSVHICQFCGGSECPGRSFF